MKNPVSIDIERRGMTVEGVWELWNQDIRIDQIVERSRTVSFSAITEGDRDNPLFASEYHDDQMKMLTLLWGKMDWADHLITYNGKAFDEKHINAEFVRAGLSRPSGYKHTDLLLFVRSKFKSDSNKLDYWVQQMGLGRKLDYGVSHSELLKGCEAGDPEALSLFKEYNIHDALLNLELYQEFRALGWL